MKIIIVGGEGTIGTKVSSYFSENHEVITAGRTCGDVNVDITDSDSIKSMFESIGEVDAIINIAGEAKWGNFNELSEEDYEIGLKSKLMGQINLVRIGKDYLSPNGSITLTTGILGEIPVNLTVSPAIVNGGIMSFVKAVVLEIENGIRVNAVSPGLVEDSVEKYGEYFPGHTPVTMDAVVKGYAQSVEGSETGEVICVY